MQADFPLFPLPLAATPHSRTALQIFEPRYLDLVKSSMSAQQCFGLIMLDAQQPESHPEKSPPPIVSMGTAVRIVDFSQQPNGLLGVVCEGVYKFRVHDSCIAESGLVVATIEAVAAEDPITLPEQFVELVTVLQSLLDHDYARSVGYVAGGDEDYWRNDAAQLSWQLASLMPVPEAVRYRWLEMDDTLVRLASILDVLNQLQDSC